MKNSLRLLVVALTFCTTGLFAQAATATAPASPSSHQQLAKNGKKSGKKKHKHHHKKK
jgi:hypothetical protein